MENLLEIACFNLESAVMAQTAGADRIELCDNYHEGGTTPSLGMITQARKHLHIPIYVMIRPRGGNFVYTPIELESMLEDIKLCKQENIDGVVFGVLTPDGAIDFASCEKLVDAARPMKITFHKAFDEIADQEAALEQLISLGINRVLTSGGAASAFDGIAKIAQLVSISAGRIGIIAGGGLRAANVQEIIRRTGITEVHSAAIVHKNQPFPHPSIHEITAIKALLI